MLLLATTAVRISEALSLDVDSLTDFHDPTDGRDYCRAKVVRKGGEEYWVAIPDEVRRVLERLAEGRETGP